MIYRNALLVKRYFHTMEILWLLGILMQHEIKFSTVRFDVVVVPCTLIFRMLPKGTYVYKFI